MMALNLARFTLIFALALRHIFAISAPMFSPSRSQSVHIMSICARLASVLRFSAIVFASVFTLHTMGASNSTKGSQDVHFEYMGSKS